jgi:hypothetical protein
MLTRADSILCPPTVPQQGVERSRTVSDPAAIFGEDAVPGDDTGFHVLRSGPQAHKGGFVAVDPTPRGSRSSAWDQCRRSGLD